MAQSTEDRTVYISGDARIPPPLKFEGNISESFKKFKQLFNIYLLASGKSKLNSETKVAILLNAIGEEGLEVFNNFNLNEEDQTDYNKVISEFEKYFSPKKNILYERFKFYSRSRLEGESIDHFVQELKSLIKMCEFEDADSMLRDRIVLGINDNQLQRKLLTLKDITLKDIVEECRSNEITKQQVQVMQEEKQVNLINRSGKPSTSTDGWRRRSFDGHQSQVARTKSSNEHRYKENTEKSYLCKKCNTWHIKGNCTAYQKVCKKCGKLNHFAVGCRSKTMRAVREVVEEDDITELENVVIETVAVCKEEEVLKIQGINTEWTEIIKVEGKQVKFKLDTGAQVNIISKQIFNNWFQNLALMKANVTLQAFGGNLIKPIGKIVANCSLKHNDIVKKLEFVVVDVKGKGNALLGMNSCAELGLIKRIELINYSSKEDFIKNNVDLFQGVGKYKEECVIRIKQTTPIVKPPRRVPLILKDVLKAELDNLTKKGIICPTKPNGWVNNLVIVEKPNGSIRVCLDPQDLNKVIVRERCLIPTIAEITAKLSNKSKFTVLDLKDGFYQVPLDKQSSELCTFSTPFGYFKFLRLPFGLSLAPEYFQKLMYNVFGNIEGVMVYFDDILIAGRDETEHDLILEEVLKKAREHGVKFNSNKIQFKVDMVKYLGLLFYKEGIKIDSERIEAIAKLEIPDSKKKLQRLLGMINFFRSFIPNLSSETQLLRDLLKENVEFMWTNLHTDAFQKIKNLLIKSPVLSNFNDELEITIQTDASKDGLGCCMLQEGKPVCFASRALTASEQNYSQIEKEFLAVVFAFKKFHLFVYGRKVTVNTDHKPLVSVMKKNVTDIGSPRLQRLKLKLLKYDIKMIYVPGKLLYVPDTLSRAYLKDCVEDDVSMLEVVHNINSFISMSDRKKYEFLVETDSDPVLKLVKKYIVEGWPKLIVSVELKGFFGCRSELHLVEGLIFYNNRVVVPKSLQNDILKILHETHNGIVATKARARDSVYWLTINKDIEKYIQKCKICEKYRPCNVKQPLINHVVPNKPFQNIAADVCQYGNNEYLVIMDYYSKWIDVYKLNGKSSDELIAKFKKCFATFGIPEKLVADNMPFASFLFKQFASEWNFEIVTSSPRYPRSNGQAESGVKIIKQMLKKNLDLEIALLNYRNTEIIGVGLSPAQLVFSRRLRSKLPIKTNMLNFEKHDLNIIRDKFHTKQELAKLYHDQHTISRDNFKVGDNVTVQKGKVWEHAQIIEKCNTPRSFKVRDEEGREYRRNTIHLRHSVNEPNINFDNGIPNQTVCTDSKETSQVLSEGTAKDSVRREKREIRLPAKYKDYVM